MQAMVGQQAPFDHGREQMKVLAGLEVTAKSVERTAEAIGADIAAGEQREIRKAVQLDLPVIVGEPLPILICANGRDRRAGREEGDPGTQRQDGRPTGARAKSSWDASSHRLHGTQKATPSAIRIRPPYTGAIETAEDFGKRIYLEAWNRGWSRAAKKVVIGDGAEWIWNLADQHFPGALQIVDLYHARQHLWELARKLHPNDLARQKAWIKVHQKRPAR